MKVNVNLTGSFVVRNQFTKDKGELVACKVDNFPADNPAYKKADGFRMNDVSLLDRLSFDLSFDEDMARIIASRVREIPQDKPLDISEKNMIATLRPSYVQTASEIAEYEERVYQYMSTTDDISDDRANEIIDLMKENVLNSDDSSHSDTTKSE